MNITLDDVELFYRTEGSGDPALVMHGGLGVDHTGYLNSGFRKLSDSLELTYYDHRCNGRTSCPGIETLTHENLAGDAEKLRAALGHESITIIGHSYGGMTALEYAWRYPSNLRRVVLIATVPVDAREEAREIAQRRAPHLMATVDRVLRGDIDRDEEIVDVLIELAPLYLNDYRRFAKEKEDFKDMIPNAAAFQHSFRELLPTYDVRDKLANIDVPVLVLGGRYDWICPLSQSELMHERLPNSELVIFEECAHALYVEQEEFFLTTVKDWLQRT